MQAMFGDQNVQSCKHMSNQTTVKLGMQSGGPTLAITRRDKYNKKLWKYYVEHGDDDESGVEDLEIRREEQEEVGP